MVCATPDKPKIMFVITVCAVSTLCKVVSICEAQVNTISSMAWYKFGSIRCRFLRISVKKLRYTNTAIGVMPASMFMPEAKMSMIFFAICVPLSEENKKSGPFEAA